MNIVRDIISGRRIVAGITNNGRAWHAVEYSNNIHVGVQMESGDYANFWEACSLEEFAERMTNA
jgi:hypothetical protein